MCTFSVEVYGNSFFFLFFYHLLEKFSKKSLGLFCKSAAQKLVGVKSLDWDNMLGLSSN